MRLWFSVMLLCLSSVTGWAQNSTTSEAVASYDFATGVLTLPEIQGLLEFNPAAATLQVVDDVFNFEVSEMTAVTAGSSAEPAQYDVLTGELFIPHLVADELHLSAKLVLQIDTAGVSRYRLTEYHLFPAATHETEASLKGGVNAPAIWLHPDDPKNSLIFGADGDGGLEIYDLSGQRINVLLPDHEVKYVDIRYHFLLGENHIDLIAFTNEADGVIELYTIDSETLQFRNIATEPVKPSITVDGMCLYHSPATGKFYTVVMDGEGAVEQWEIFANSTSTVNVKLARSFNVGGETGSCLADDTAGKLFIGEQEAALWRYGAEPEDGIGRKAIDVAEPLGHIIEVEGLTMYYGRDDSGYLLVANQDYSEYLVYERAGDNPYLGKFSVLTGINGVDGISEGEGIAVTNVALNSTYSKGIFIAQDDVNPDANNNLKLIPWENIASYLDLKVDTSIDPRELGLAASSVKSVAVTGETVPVPVSGDAADDPAIWIHPSEKSLSTVIGTQKQGGIVVYNLKGEQVQYLAAGNINNVDLRYNFTLSDGSKVDIAAGTNRTDHSLSLFRIDPITRELSDIAARTISVPTQDEVYGLCMYHSPTTGQYYVFVNDTQGEVTQWALFASDDNKVDAQQVRAFSVGSQTEGCVADDVTGDFYIGEENVAIWKYKAEPDADDTRVQIDTHIANGGHFTADVEGLTLYYVDGGGYLIASSQGSNSYTIYERQGNNAYIGEFRLIGNDDVGIDGASDTDGITVSNVALGDLYPNGLFVVQDGRNIVPDENQNFKYASWADIAAQFDLVVNTDYDPRQ